MILEARRGKEIVGGFFDAYNTLGFGLPERMCANALVLELQRRGLNIVREVCIDVMHLGVSIGTFRLDMVVDNRVIVEVKAVKTLEEADTRQLLAYLKASQYEVGLLLNFGVESEYRRFIYTNDRKAARSNSCDSCDS